MKSDVEVGLEGIVEGVGCLLEGAFTLIGAALAVGVVTVMCGPIVLLVSLFF